MPAAPGALPSRGQEKNRLTPAGYSEEGSPLFIFLAVVPRSGVDSSKFLAVATCLLPAKTVSRETGEK